MRIVTSTIRFNYPNRRKATARALANAVTSNGVTCDSLPGRPLVQRSDPLLIPGFGPAPQWCDRIAEVIVAVAVVTPFVVWWVLR
jgi:hypothetical protein